MSTGSSLDLLVLKELLGRMGGCDTLLEVSTQQLEGLAGGRALQAEVMGAQVSKFIIITIVNINFYTLFIHY